MRPFTHTNKELLTILANNIQYAEKHSDKTRNECIYQYFDFVANSLIELGRAKTKAFIQACPMRDFRYYYLKQEDVNRIKEELNTITQALLNLFK